VARAGIKVDDNTNLKPVGGYPEEIAFSLMELIANVEGKQLQGHIVGSEKRTAPDRKWILDCYAECLATARGHRSLK
jgi:hypothetical protein